MRRATAACGSMEAKLPAKMEKKGFDRQTDSISRGHRTALSFVGESGAAGNGGGYGIMPQPTGAQAALDRPAETVPGPGRHAAFPMRGDQASARRAVEAARKPRSRTRCPFRRQTARRRGGPQALPFSFVR